MGPARTAGPRCRQQQWSHSEEEEGGEKDQGRKLGEEKRTGTEGKGGPGGTGQAEPGREGACLWLGWEGFSLSLFPFSFF